MPEAPEIRLAQRPDADALLGRSPPAALVGMLLPEKPAVHRCPGAMAKVRAREQGMKAAAKAAKAAKEGKSPGNC